MRNLVLSTILVLLILSSGCASMQAFERSSETKMIVILEKLDEGGKTGTIPPESSKVYYSTLHCIQAEYAGLNGKSISREERDHFQGKLASLEIAVNSALFRVEEPKDSDLDYLDRYEHEYGVRPQASPIKVTTRGERIDKLQWRIDNGRSSGAFSLLVGDGFQSKLDYIRSMYLQLLGQDTAHATEGKEVVSRLLDSLENDLEHVPQL